MLLSALVIHGEPMSTSRLQTRGASRVVLQRRLLAIAAALALAPCVSAQPGSNTRGAKSALRGELVAAAAPVAAGAPVPSATPCARVEMAPAVQVSVGKSTVVRPPSPVTRILLGNPVGSQAARPTEAKAKDDKREATPPTVDDKTRPGVADVDVLLLSPSEVYLLGKSIGSTNVVLADRAGHCTAFDVVVNMDTGALQGAITQLLPEEKDVRVSAAFDSVILTGSVTDVGAVTRVLDLANVFVRTAGGGNGASATGANPRIVNMMSTGAPQQVMLEVKVAEVSKALLDRFGINFSRAYATADSSVLNFLSGIFGGTAGLTGHISGTGPSGVPTSSVGTVIGGSIPSAVPNVVGGNVTKSFDPNGNVVYTTTYGTVPGRNATNVALDMQKTDGLVKILAEPTVMAISGQKGSFLAGGKIFIPVAQQTGAGGGTAITLEEKEFGVSVGFLPTVLDGGRINLEVASEVSELNRDGVALSAPGVAGITVLPSFTSRRARTTVQLLDGQSFAVGGLIKNNTTTSVTAFPFLGELPVIGALFRSTQFQTDKSELVFVITPRLVKPLPSNYRLPTDNYVPPTRSDVILGGRLEGRREPAAPSDAAAAPSGAASAPGGGFQVK
jgi:pilus assembly protein CpaC